MSADLNSLHGIGMQDLD